MRVTEILSEKMSARARHAAPARKNLRKGGGRKEGANEGFKDNDNFVRATGLLLSVFTGMNWLLTKYDYGEVQHWLELIARKSQIYILCEH